MIGARIVTPTLLVAAATALTGCIADAPSSESPAPPRSSTPFQSSDAWTLPLAPGDRSIGRVDSTAPEENSLSFENLRGNSYVTYAACGEDSQLQIEVEAVGDVGPNPRVIDCNGTISRHTVAFDPDQVALTQMTVTGTGEWAVSLAWQETPIQDTSDEAPDETQW